MPAAKKEFRKRLINLLIIVYGMMEDKRYDYLFNKIDKYRKRMIDFPTAIRMGVKSSAAIIDQEFEDMMDNDSSTDGEDSKESMSVAY